MRAALALFSHLSDTDLTWLLSNAERRVLGVRATLVREGEQPEALFIVLHGVFDVHVELLGDTPIDQSGPGELIGEMSFLEGKPATATLTAREPTVVLALTHDRLHAQLEGDPAFAARLYRAFALVLSARHRRRLSKLEAPAATDGADALEPLWQPCAEAIDRFKQLIRDADLEALANKDDGTLTSKRRAAVIDQFRRMSQLLSEQVSARADLRPVVRAQLGARIKRELLPFLLLTSTSERFYSKPRGYAGDFKTIDNVYREHVGGSGRIGELIDTCIVVHEPASQAVRHRRRLIAEELVQGVKQHQGEAPYRVTVLASGPASEVFDAFARIGDPERLEVTLIDIDPQAIELVRERLDEHELARPGVAAQVRTELANLIYLATGREQLELPPQDFVYSMGLIDYLKPRFVVALLDYVHGLLRPGGRVMLGNFHPDTGTRALMDYVFDWKLIFRTEADIRELYARSQFGACARVVFEDAGVDMFAEGVKQAG